MKEYTNSQIIQLIEEHVHSDRDRRLLKRRLVDGICYEALSEEFDMSDRQIRRIIYKLQERLFKYL